MRYTDDGYISTEVELPKDGSRVLYSMSPKTIGKDPANYKNPSIATFKNGEFHFDSHWGYGNKVLSSGNGYWRYIDTPAQEKLDTGHPDALQGYLGELRDMLYKFADEMSDLGGEIDEYIFESERLNKLSQEGWAISRDAMPEDYVDTVEIMRDGKILGKGHAFSNVSGFVRGWTIQLQNIDASGTYWRPIIWQKSTPENLAKLASKEVVEVKTEDEQIRKGFLCYGSTKQWHLGNPRCCFMKGGTASDNRGCCAECSTQGTWFRRLPRQ